MKAFPYLLVLASVAGIVAFRCARSDRGIIRDDQKALPAIRETIALGSATSKGHEFDESAPVSRSSRAVVSQGLQVLPYDRQEEPLATDGLVAVRQVLICETQPDNEILGALHAWDEHGAALELEFSQGEEILGYSWSSGGTPRVVCAESRSGALAYSDTLERGDDGIWRVYLDFSISANCRFTVVDDVNTKPLDRVEITRIAIGACMGVDSLGATSGSVGVTTVLATSNDSGRVELRCVIGVAQRLLLRRIGYQDEIVEVPGSNDGDINLGRIAMLAVDSVEVRLVGYQVDELSQYAIRSPDSDDRAEFNENGIVWLSIGSIYYDPVLELSCPKGLGVRIALSGYARDHSPITIDVRRESGLYVECLGAEDQAVGVQLYAIVSREEDLKSRVSIVQKVENGVAQLTVPFSGNVTVGILAFGDNWGGWIALEDVELLAKAETAVVMEVGNLLGTAGVRLVDETGNPVEPAMFAVERASPPWIGVNRSSPSGWLPIPGAIGTEFRLSGQLSNGAMLFDLPVVVSAHGHPASEFVLREPLLFEIELRDGSMPLDTYTVTLNGSVGLANGFQHWSDADGLIRDLDIFPGSAPLCVIIDPRLFEIGRGYPLHPGRTTINVRRVASFELVLAGQIVAEQLTVERLGEPGALAGWIAEGRSSRTELVRDEVRVLRFGNVPLGDYEWSDPSGRRGTVEVREAGRIRVVELP